MPKKTKKKVVKKVTSVNDKLNQIIALQKRLLKEEGVVEKEEEQLEKIERVTEFEAQNENRNINKLESEILSGEKKEEDELSKLEALEREIKSEVGEHPLSRITLKGILKGLVGAFVGLAVHYTFTYGVEISESLTTGRAAFLYLLSFIVGIVFIYFTGFRKIKDPKILMFIPVRLFVLYLASIAMSIIVLYIFYPTFGHDFFESFKMVGGVLLAAIVGACTADLIGKE